MIEVRRVHPDEYVEAAEVTASAWQPLGSPHDPKWLTFRARIADVAGRDAVATVFVATEGGHILGSVTLEVGDRVPDEDNPAPLAPDEAHVRLLAVKPAARRRGVGARLMSHCASVARQSGKARLTLNTSEGNVEAQRFYEAIGFIRLADVLRDDGTTLRSYGLGLLPVADR
ncbi:MAG TPA: GNAT family N-acetyltransferase [Acidimicrobiales bacterium]|nr:GNAT family N-acetyltransferase [Acidimicrobiales bacterium]